jgi:hypothetical protein
MKAVQLRVVFHGYGFQLEWARMAEGVIQIEGVFSDLQCVLSSYLKGLAQSNG